MKLLKFGMVVVALSAGIFAFGEEAHKHSPNRVAGMWRPVTIKGTLHGVVSQPFGPHPDGLLMFDENLHFVECIVDPDTPRFAVPDRQNGKPDEIRAAFLGSLGLFGTYSVNNKGEFTGNHVDGSHLPKLERQHSR